MSQYGPVTLLLRYNTFFHFKGISQSSEVQTKPRNDRGIFIFKDPIQDLSSQVQPYGEQSERELAEKYFHIRSSFQEIRRHFGPELDKLAKTQETVFLCFQPYEHWGLALALQ